MAEGAHSVSVTDLLDHYARRFHERMGGPPRKRDLDLTLARTLLQGCGPDRVIEILDAWFDADDPWYAAEGFEFIKAFAAINRLVATGQLEPSGAPRLRAAIRGFAIAIQQPRLRLVR